MRRFGVGLIGLGLAVKQHVLALRELGERVGPVVGYSPTDVRRQAFERTWRLPTVATLDALLDDRTIDVVFVLTPPRTHAAIALRVGASGRDVLLEKPVDVDLDHARALVAGVERTGRRLAVVFQQRFRDGALALRALLDEGELGELLTASCAVRWWRSAEYFAEAGRGTQERDGGGVLLTQAIHTLDVLLGMTGPARRVDAICRTSPLRSIDTEDVVCAAVEFASGACGVIDATTASYPGNPERIDIAGTRGSALLEGGRLLVRRHGQPDLLVEGSLAGGGGADPMAFPHEPHRRLIADFFDALENGREPVAGGRSALPVHALIDALLASGRNRCGIDVAPLSR